jgi:hypothetical protein
MHNISLSLKVKNVNGEPQVLLVIWGRGLRIYTRRRLLSAQDMRPQGAWDTILFITHTLKL